MPKKHTFTAAIINADGSGAFMGVPFDVEKAFGAKESLAGAGYSMHAVLMIGQLLEYWEENGKVEKSKIEATRKFLQRG